VPVPWAAAPAFGRGRATGMTLMEIVLVLALVVLLAGVIVGGMGRSRSHREFLEAANRFETVLRMARAEAQNEKRRLRVEFGEPEGALDPDLPTPVRVLWEPEHLTAPGDFVPYPMSTWASSVPTELVRVLSSRHIGPSAYRTITSLTGGGDDDDPEALQAVTFYPDGWSDSVLIELAPPELHRSMRAAIRLDGDSGNVTALIVTESELEDHHDEIVEGTYDPDAEEDL